MHLSAGARGGKARALFFAEEIGHIEADRRDDVLGGAAGKTLKQNAPVVAFIDRKTVFVIVMAGASCHIAGALRLDV